jgi:hypothetical protein
MDTLHHSLLTLHVLAGSAGLLTMLLPLLSHKGARVHRQSGWTFVAAMAVVSLTGAGLAGSHAPVEGTFFALIALLTGNALVQAITSLRRKHSPAPAPRPVELTSLVLLAGWSLFALVLGVGRQHGLLVVFALLGLGSAAGDARFTLRPLASRHAYLYQHIGATGTACVTAVTAFVVQAGPRYLPPEVLGDVGWLLWIAPGVVLGAVFRVFVARSRQKLEPAPPSAELAAPHAAR